MIWPWRRSMTERARPEQAREGLARIRGQQPDVEKLVNQLQYEGRANRFAANVEKVFMGRRA
jgi:Tfp pilus assembly protein FimV